MVGLESMKPYLEFGKDSRAGKNRTENQDYVLAYVPAHPTFITRRGALFGIADGVGGQAGGKIASYLITRYVLQAYYGELQNTPAVALQQAVVYANNWLRYWSSMRSDLRGMSTTLTAVAVWDGELVIAHVGDCRVYLVRQAYTWQLTKDHTWITDAMGRGLLTPYEAAHHPWRHMLTRSLKGNAVTVDLMRWQYIPGDRLVICSDGVYDLLPARELAHYAQIRPQRAARSLLRSARKRKSYDDASAVVIALHYYPTWRSNPARPSPLRDYRPTYGRIGY